MGGVSWYKLVVYILRGPKTHPKTTIPKTTAFTRAFSKSSRELLPSSLWRESGTRRKLFRKKNIFSNDFFFLFWVDFFVWIFLLWMLLAAKKRAYFCKSIAIEIGGVSRYFSKYWGQGSMRLSWRFIRIARLEFATPTFSSQGFRPLCFVYWPNRHSNLCRATLCGATFSRIPRPVFTPMCV